MYQKPNLQIYSWETCPLNSWEREIPVAMENERSCFGFRKKEKDNGNFPGPKLTCINSFLSKLPIYIFFYNQIDTNIFE